MTGDGCCNIPPAHPLASRASRRAGSTLFLLLLACLAVLPLRRAAADYIVQQGDVLEIDVLGAPGLHRRVPVDAGGQVALPLLGDIDAAGKSLTELRTNLRALLLAKNIVRHAEVVIDVAEYRPVYVGGDVAKPGAYSYRPGMTVRDAVALAQGYDVFHLHGKDSLLEAANAQADYESDSVELAKQVMRIMRLKAELAGSRELDFKNAAELAVKAEVLGEIKQFESQRLAADWADRDREKAHLEQTLKGAQDQLGVLKRQQQQDAAVLEQQNMYLARARGLAQRGLMQNSRMEELQRAVGTAQSQTFEIQSRVAQAQKEVDDLSRKLQTVDDERRARLLQELQEATTQAATARYRFKAAAEKAKFMATTQNESSAPAEPPQITIYRVTGGKEQKTTADEATSLSPGDNIAIVTKPKKAVKPASLQQTPVVAGR